METKINYTWIGLFVVILSIALVVIPVWLSAGLTTKHYRIYALYMNEAVSGLSIDAAVKYNGVDVGTVKSIAIDANNPQLVYILLNIQDGTPINIGTTATLMTQGITGVTYIALKSGNRSLPPLVAAPDQPYPVIKTTPSLLFRLDAVVTKLADNITQVSDQINILLSPANQRAFSQTLASINRFTSALASNSDKLNSSINSANILLKNSAAASAQFPIVINNFDNTANQIDRAVQQLNAITQNFNSATMPRVNSILSNVQTLSKDVKQNPSILIRGQAPAAPGPGE